MLYKMAYSDPKFASIIPAQLSSDIDSNYVVGSVVGDGYLYRGSLHGDW